MGCGFWTSSWVNPSTVKQIWTRKDFWHQRGCKTFSLRDFAFTRPLFQVESPGSGCDTPTGDSSLPPSSSQPESKQSFPSIFTNSRKTLRSIYLQIEMIEVWNSIERTSRAGRTTLHPMCELQWGWHEFFGRLTICSLPSSGPARKLILPTLGRSFFQLIWSWNRFFYGWQAVQKYMAIQLLNYIAMNSW